MLFHQRLDLEQRLCTRHAMPAVACGRAATTINGRTVISVNSFFNMEATANLAVAVSQWAVFHSVECRNPVSVSGFRSFHIRLVMYKDKIWLHKQLEP